MSSNCIQCDLPQDHPAHTPGVPPGLLMRRSEDDPGAEAHEFIGKPPPTPKEVIETLRSLNTQFYWACFLSEVGSRAHGFIEFNGIMSKYIDLLAMAVELGIDPQHINEHNGVALPVEDHDMKYLGEKLRCLFGPVIDRNPKARAALKKALFG